MLDSLFEQFDRLVFVDVETSGLDPSRDEIIELGIIRVVRVDGQLLTDRETGMLIRLSQGKKLSQTITQITGITQEMLASDGADKAAACQVLADVLGHTRTLVVAYNAQFDLCFLYNFLLGFGQEKVLSGIKMLDALTVFRDRRAYPHKLENAVAAYNLPTKTAHRAVDDAGTTYALLCAMEAEQNDLARYINLFGYNPKYGVTGKRISSVKYLPQSYTREKKLYE